MKNIYSLLAVLLFMCMLLSPLLAREGIEKTEKKPPKTAEKDVFLVLCGDEIKTLNATEYVCGVVSAEMPALYENEALKAQAVAAYTYAARKREQRKEEDYHITSSSDTDQAYIDKEQQKEKWGEKYEEYSEKIAKAVESVKGQKLTYDGELCMSVYHAISAGKTEKASVVWGEDFAYLQSVESIGDLLSPDYKSEVLLSPEELSEKLKDKITPTGEPSSWFGECQKSEIGSVQKISVCGSEISGSELREKLGLRSTNFSVEFVDNKFKITVLGYGHGVGMSQYGANCMAQQGSDYKEILAWYYKGSKLE